MNDLIVELRQRTGVGVMACKKALDEANGDIVRAEQIIRERESPESGDGTATAGAVFCRVHGGRFGVMLELRCETDFAARTEVFQRLGEELVTHLLGVGAADVSELLFQHFIRPTYDSQGNTIPAKTIEQMVRETSSQLGEAVVVARFVRYELGR